MVTKLGASIFLYNISISKQIFFLFLRSYNMSYNIKRSILKIVPMDDSSSIKDMSQTNGNNSIFCNLVYHKILV